MQIYAIQNELRRTLILGGARLTTASAVPNAYEEIKWSEERQVTLTK